MVSVSVFCPRCRRVDRIPITENNELEYYLWGSTITAIYHIDHILLVSIDRYGIRSIDICDPPSILMYSLNIVVGNYMLIRNPPLTLKYETILVDLNRKLVDARTVQNHMYAVSFVRYLSKNIDKIPGRGIINAYGMKFLVERKGAILVATRLGKNNASEDIESWVERLINIVDEVPLAIEKWSQISQESRT